MDDTWRFAPLPPELAEVPVGGSARLAADVFVTGDARAVVADLSVEALAVTTSDRALERGTVVGVVAERRMLVHAASAADSELVVRLLGTPGAVVDDDALSPVMLQLLVALSA